MEGVRGGALTLCPPWCPHPTSLKDNQGLTIGVLVTILCLLAVGFVVYLKRKTLVQLLFMDKKTTIEKLRCVRPSRLSGGSQPGQAHLTHLSKGLMRKPPHCTANKASTRRPLPSQNVDISRPLKAPDVPQPISPQQVLPRLHKAPRGTRMPNPPQKPLPADPLNKTMRLANASSRTLGQQESGLPLAPIRHINCPDPPTLPLRSEKQADTFYQQ
ncbi:hypothetical protein MC885_001853 [Smutsia gigantea]|nr:hypothetical protein MC885_001853 [Smutsia gigantea]